LTHVAEIMNQQTHAALVFVMLLQRLEQIADLILEFRLFDLERQAQRSFEFESALGLTRAALEQCAQPCDSRVLEDYRAWPIEHPFEIEHGGHQVKRADVAR